MELTVLFLEVKLDFLKTAAAVSVLSAGASGAFSVPDVTLPRPASRIMDRKRDAQP